MAANGVTVEGLVLEALGNMKFKVKLGNEKIVTAHIGGKMSKNNIKVIPGDKVTVELCVYDLSKGRIIYRTK